MKTKVKIGNNLIGENQPTYIIAEIGSNHNKDIKIAKKLIDKAVKAKADAVKFQTFKAEKLYSKNTPKFSKDSINPYELIKSLELPRDWHKELYKYCKNKGIEFLSSPFDFEAVDELEKVGIKAYKIASFEINDLELLSYTAKKKKPIILSTGMANINEINEAIDCIRSVGNNDIILLHCNSMYPTPMDIVNLNAIPTMKKEFNIPIGFSDHTLGIHIPIAAVGKGANIIEKHFTLDRKMKGPDHHFAIEPDELELMVKYIRDIDKAQGDGVKKVSEKEKEMYEKGRRSIIAKKDIKKDRQITREMLIVKRPGYGIKPKFIKELIGKKAKRDIKKDQWIEWKDVEK